MTDFQAIDKVVDEAIAAGKLVGTVLLVARDGEIIYCRAAGLADREAGTLMREDAIFRLSSVTKPIVAATILALGDAGLLRIDAPVTDYLPNFRPRLPDGSTPVITIANLLTHTSGLASGDLPWHSGDDAVLAAIAARPLLFAPGTSWAYGPSIDVLGALAGKLVGGKPEDALRRYVLDPLGMDDTRFSVTDVKRLATAYGDGAEGPVRMGEVHSVTAPWGGVATYNTKRIFDTSAFQSGGGGMAGTAADVLHLLEALRTGGGTILAPETARIGMANATPQLAQAGEPGWGFSHFGACITDKSQTPHPGNVGTNRWGGIYGHHWVVDPVARLTVVSMSNTGLEGCDGAYRYASTKAVYRALGL